MEPDLHLLQVIFHYGVTLGIAPTLAILVCRNYLMPFYHGSNEVREAIREWPIWLRTQNGICQHKRGSPRKGTCDGSQRGVHQDAGQQDAANRRTAERVIRSQ